MKLMRHATPDGGHDWTGDFLDLQRAVVDAAGNFPAVLQAVLDGALRLLPQASGAIYATCEGERLRVTAASGHSATWIDNVFPVDGSLAGFAVSTRELQSCPDVVGDARVDPDVYGRSDVRAVLVMPLLHSGEVAGVLGLQATMADAFGERDQLVVQLLAGPIVIGLSALHAADAQRARHVADRRFEATFAYAPVGIAHVGLDGRFLRLNDRFCAITGWSRDELLVHGFQQITHADDLDADLAYVDGLLAGGTDRYTMEKRYLRPDASSVWVNLTVSLVRDTDGRPEFFVSVIEDLSDIKRAQAEALRDPLTGLFNRRGAIERIRRATAPETRRHGRLGLIYLDLDGFKAINDRQGHAAGDACLVEVARAIGGVIRPGDSAARVGGDEFIVMMSGLGSSGLARVAGRLRAAIAGVGTGGGWRVSASLGGLAWIAGDEETPESLIARADQAMFRAKQAGKDRVYIMGG